MNWGLGFCRLLPCHLLAFSVPYCVTALSSNARVPLVRSAFRLSRALSVTENSSQFRLPSGKAEVHYFCRLSNFAMQDKEKQSTFCALFFFGGDTQI